jgi:CHASE2 domain-containing sensor protein
MNFPRVEQLSRRWSWLNPVTESIAKLIRPLLVASLLVTGTTVGARFLGVLEFTELAAYDHLMQLKPDAPTDDRILVVGITENHLQTLQEWPISDRTLTQALEQLEQHQPQTIAIDIFRDFPYEPGNQQLLSHLQAHPHIFTICKVSAANDMGTPPPPGVPAEQVGFSDLVVDPGGILRRSLLMTGTPEPTMPFPKQHLCNQPQQTLISLSLQTVIRYLAAQNIEADFTEDQQLRLGTTVIPQIPPHMGGYQRADTQGYQIMLHYRSGKRAVPEVSLMAVLNNQVDPVWIRDRIIFLGYTTPQAKDDFYTPYSAGKDDQQKMPGVIVHAQSASQLISAVLDQRPLIWVWPEATEVFWILIWSLVGGILGWYLRHPAAFTLITLAGLTGLYSVSLVLFMQGGWIPLVPAAITFVGTAVGVVLLDRFSRSDYGQQVYRKVRTFLRLEIEIDEEKLEKQVSEITDTEYFRNLQDKVKRIRAKHSKTAAASRTEWPHSHTAVPWRQHQEASIAAQDSNLASLLQSGIALPPDGESRQITPLDRLSLSPAIAPPVGPDAAAPPAPKVPATPDRDQDLPSPPQSLPHTTLPREEIPSPSDYEVDFLELLNQKAQLLKHNLGADIETPTVSASCPQPQQRSTNKQPSTTPQFSPFHLDSPYCGYIDQSTVTQAYLDEITRKLAKLKAGLD